MRADSKTFTCDCCAGYCPKCKPKDAKVNIRFHESLLRAQTAFDICKDVRVEFKKAWQKLKRYLEVRIQHRLCAGLLDDSIATQSPRRG